MRNYDAHILHRAILNLKYSTLDLENIELDLYRELAILFPTHRIDVAIDPMNGFHPFKVIIQSKAMSVEEECFTIKYTQGLAISVQLAEVTKEKLYDLKEAVVNLFLKNVEGNSYVIDK